MKGGGYDDRRGRRCGTQMLGGGTGREGKVMKGVWPVED
jgi:hypothetical protein